MQAGGALHFAVVTAPIAGVPPDTICSYNVTLDVQGDAVNPPGWSGQWDLGGLKLLDLDDPSDDYQGGLGYAEGRLPSFASPPADVKDLRLFHGSCFKMHGEGPSILPNIDDLLGDALPADATGETASAPAAAHRRPDLRRRRCHGAVAVPHLNRREPAGHRSIPRRCRCPQWAMCR